MRKLFLTAAALGFIGIVSPASAEDLEFMINNKTKTDVVEIYASPVSADDWEDNMLAEDAVLKHGDFVKATIKSGKGKCKYDLKFVFSDKEEVVEKDIDLCDTGSYTLEDEK